MSRAFALGVASGLVLALVGYLAAAGMRDASAGELHAAADEARARVHAEDMARALARADSAALEVLALREAAADSLARWEAERERARSVIRVATERRLTLADSLRTRVDSVTALIVDDMEAATAEMAGAYEAQIATLTGERDMLRVEVGLLGSEVTALRESLGSLGVAYELQRAASAGLQRALAGERRRSSIVTVVGGVLAAKLAYDLIAGG